MIEISVIICTFNRLDYLKKALNSLLKQSYDNSKFEVIIVDNNSSDNTQSYVKNLIRRLHRMPAVKYIFEKKSGAGTARNTGVLRSEGRLVAFLDDDSIADTDWLKNGNDLFRQNLFRLYAVGGIIKPVFETAKPEWFKENYEGYSKGDKDRYLHRWESFSCSNMIFQKEIIIRFGGFDTKIDIKNKFLSVGEETAIFERIWHTEVKNQMFYYSPSLLVYHHVPDFKTNMNYRLKRSFISGQSLYLRKTRYIGAEKYLSVIRFVIGVGFYFLLFPVLLIRELNIRRAIFESLNPAAYAIGYLTAVCGYKIRIKRIL